MEIKIYMELKIHEHYSKYTEQRVKGTIKRIKVF